MIVKVKFKDENGEYYTMLFGNSYKRWQFQIKEYCFLTNSQIVQAWYSRAMWVGYGGLKWCDEAGIQEQLDKEAAAENKKPRQYSEMKFYPMRLYELPI